MGQPLLHGSDLGGELGVGETLGLELQEVREDADAEVDELDGEEDEEGGEVSYLENFIKIHRHSQSIPTISFMRTIIDIVDSEQQTSVPRVSAHLKFSRVNNIDGDVDIEEEAHHQAGAACQQSNH